MQIHDSIDSLRAARPEVFAAPVTFTAGAADVRLRLAPGAPAPRVVAHAELAHVHAAGGPLAGLSFAAKDLFDIAGYPTGGGSPIVLALSGIKTRTAPTVQKLVSRLTAAGLLRSSRDSRAMRPARTTGMSRAPHTTRPTMAMTASKACASPYFTCTVGLPRRNTSLSMQGMSS